MEKFKNLEIQWLSKHVTAVKNIASSFPDEKIAGNCSDRLYHTFWIMTQLNNHSKSNSSTLEYLLLILVVCIVGAVLKDLIVLSNGYPLNLSKSGGKHLRIIF